MISTTAAQVLRKTYTVDMFTQDAWVIANDESSCLGIFYVNQEGGIVIR